jgi:hypothetical protein
MPGEPHQWGSPIRTLARIRAGHQRQDGSGLGPDDPPHRSCSTQTRWSGKLWHLLASPREEACAKTTVFLHEHFIPPSPSPPASLWFTILVQQNNVREIRADMSKAHRSHRLWVWTDVRRLFSESVGSFSTIVGLSSIIFSSNVGMRMRCYRAEWFIFSGRYIYIVYIRPVVGYA